MGNATRYEGGGGFPRARVDIEQSIRRSSSDYVMQGLTLEVLLDIRDLLFKLSSK
jgi:hypothetical protein